MAKLLGVGGVVLAWASAAAAAPSLTVTPSATNINPGDPLLVKISADSEDETAGIFRVELNFSASDGSLEALPTGTRGTLNSDSMAGFFWENTTVGGTCPDTRGNCIAADAFEFVTVGGFPIDLEASTLATFSFDTSGVAPGGTLSFEAFGAGVAGFFGSEETATATVSVETVSVPEPATAALLGLGLIGLAAAGRRRA